MIVLAQFVQPIGKLAGGHEIDPLHPGEIDDQRRIEVGMRLYPREESVRRCGQFPFEHQPMQGRQALGKRHIDRALGRVVPLWRGNVERERVVKRGSHEVVAPPLVLQQLEDQQPRRRIAGLFTGPGVLAGESKQIVFVGQLDDLADPLEPLQSNQQVPATGLIDARQALEIQANPYVSIDRLAQRRQGRARGRGKTGRRR